MANAAPSDSSPPDIEREKLELERFKARLDYRKFVLASVFGAIAIAAIPPLFQLATAFLEYVKTEQQLKIEQANKEADRSAKQDEFREVYIKEFLNNALNQDVELRIRFAEYFSHVSAEPFRPGWIEYVTALREQREKIRVQINDMEAEWRAETAKPSRDEAKLNRIERNLAWAYKEVGYVEKDRSAAANPRTSEADLAPAVGFGIAFGADKTPEAAMDEVKKAKQISDNPIILYLREGYWRSVMFFGTRSAAGDELPKLQKQWSDAYIVDISKWCPQPKRVSAETKSMAQQKDCGF